MQKLNKYLLLLIIGLLPVVTFATHNRGGEITYTHISGLTYEFTITTCTDVGDDAQANRDELFINYGDGEGDTIPRISETFLPLDHKKSVYTGQHTYSSPGSYIICMEDPNRNGGIINIYTGGAGNSDDVVFSIQSKLIIDPFAGNNGANNSVVFNDCPCPAQACVGQQYCYNNLAVDIDDDSLSYMLVAPFGENCAQLPVPTMYQFPHLVNGGTNTFTIDPITGTMCWDSPSMAGEFNYTIKVTEWRNGAIVGHVIRDVQLTIISGCSNDSPVLSPIPDVCVVAGDPIEFTVSATDVNTNVLSLTASGLALSLNSTPAVFDDATGAGTVSSVFSWNTSCDNIKDNPYQILFSVEDNGTPQFADNAATQITIIPPQVTGISANPIGNNVSVTWDPTSCNNAEGYRIYRTTSQSLNLPTDCCSDPNLNANGFTQIGQIFGINNTSFVDNAGLTLGLSYCYLVRAFYEIGQVESCPSDTSCARLKKEVPVITHVSVLQTNASAGIDSIMWSKPTEMDTTQYPGPYRYKVYHGLNANNVNTLIGQTASTTSLYNSDTTFTHFNINTNSQANYYRVELFYDSLGTSLLVGTSNNAGSVFISTIPSDNQITVSWNEDVPWVNTNYFIYRANNFSGPFTLVGTSTAQSFADTGLINGSQYCYYVQSQGYYTSSSIVSPILNLSQIACDSPIDLTPPCPPVLSINGNCEIGENTLTWTNPNNLCADDVMSYNLYYTPIEGNEMTLIGTFDNNGDTAFTHNDNGSIAGCYAVTAVDSVQYGNESDSSNVVCFDNCPSYWLPNVFSPNGDGINDLFSALVPYNYVESVNIQIYNRWGQLIFETVNPDVNWDGIHMKSGKIVPDGVYYYLCTVNTIRLTGIEPIFLKGFFHLFSQGNGIGG
jgi:gliding motility-associated-like protein